MLVNKLKSQAHELVENLPENAPWDDLMHDYIAKDSRFFAFLLVLKLRLGNAVFEASASRRSAKRELAR